MTPIDSQVEFNGRKATFLGVINRSREYYAIIRVEGRWHYLQEVQPSEIGVYVCHYCGWLEEPRDDLWENQDWPRCPNCQGC